MWNLSSPTRDWTHVPCIARGVLNHWTTSEVPSTGILIRVANGEGNGTPLQYSCLENPMDRGACWAAVHGVTTSRILVSNFTFTFYFHALEKEMATHSSVLAWRIPGTGEPGGPPSMGSHRVGHDWSDLAAAMGVEHTWGVRIPAPSHACVSLVWAGAKSPSLSSLWDCSGKEGCSQPAPFLYNQHPYHSPQGAFSRSMNPLSHPHQGPHK